MLRTLLCDSRNHFLVVEDLDIISDLIGHKDQHLWLDLENPTTEELYKLKDEFGLHPLAIEDASLRHQRPKVDQYADSYFVVFYAVGLVELHETAGDASLPARRGLRGSRFHAPESHPPLPKMKTTYEPGSLVATPHSNGTNPANGGDGGNGGNGAKRPDEQQAMAPEAGPTVRVLPDNGGHDRIVLNEISMFMGENYLITVHKEPIYELEEVARRWYRNVVTIRGEMHPQPPPRGTRPLTEAETKALQPSGEDMRHPIVAGHTELAPGVKAPDTQDQTSPTRMGGGGVQQEMPGPHANDVGILLYSLLDTIVDQYFPVVDTIVDRIEDLEEEIFENFNQGAIQDVFNLKKDLLALRKVLAPERDVLNILTRRDLPLFEQHTLVYFQDVYDHVVRVTDSIDTYRDLLSSALDSFLSMQSNRLNVTVQTLTSVSIILMSIAAFTGWFGMNFANMPELHSAWGYPALIAVVIIVVGVELVFFKRKGWL